MRAWLICAALVAALLQSQLALAETVTYRFADWPADDGCTQVPRELAPAITRNPELLAEDAPAIDAAMEACIAAGTRLHAECQLAAQAGTEGDRRFGCRRLAVAPSKCRDRSCSVTTWLRYSLSVRALRTDLERLRAREQ